MPDPAPAPFSSASSSASSAAPSSASPSPSAPPSGPKPAASAFSAGAAAPTLLDPRLQHMLLVLAWMAVIAGGVATVAFAWPLVAKILGLLLPFLVAFVIAYIFDPIVTFVQERLKLSRVVGMIAFYAFLLIVFLGFFALLLPALYDQASSGVKAIQENAPKKAEELMRARGIEPSHLRTLMDDWLTSKGLSVESLAMQAGQSAGVRRAAQTAAEGGYSVLRAGFKFLGDLLSSIFSGFAFAVLVLIVNFYMLLDFNRFRRMFLPMIPSAWRDRTIVAARKLDYAVGGFIRGQMIDCALVGLMTTIGLMALGLKQYALLIGFIAGFCNFIPYLGPLMGEIPAVLFILLSDSYEWPREKLIYSGLVVGLFAIIQAIDGLVLQPKIVGKAAQLHPLAVILALVIGGQFGMMGMIVAVPAACMVRVLWKEFYWDRRVAALKQSLRSEWKKKGSANKNSRIPGAGELGDEESQDNKKEISEMENGDWEAANASGSANHSCASKRKISSNTNKSSDHKENI